MQTVPDSLFRPDSVAIIGAGEKPGQIGSGLVLSITDGFAGPVYCVNPQYERLLENPVMPRSWICRRACPMQ